MVSQFGNASKFLSINIHADNEGAYRLSCKGHLEITKWLVVLCSQKNYS